MTRIVHAPEGSLVRGLLARIAEEATAEPPKPVRSQFAALMPVRKVG